MLQLTSRGYKAFIVGGYIRDSLLMNPINDVDIITTCPPSELPKIFSSAGNVNPHRPEHYRLKGIELISTNESSLKEEALKRDITLNAFFYDLFHIYDPLNVKSHLSSPYLVIIGDTDARLTQDPSIILRMIRFSNCLDKTILPEDYHKMLTAASKINTLPWGILTSWYQTLGKMYRESKVGWKISNPKIWGLIIFIRLNGLFHIPRDDRFTDTFDKIMDSLQDKMKNQLSIDEAQLLCADIKSQLEMHVQQFTTLKATHSIDHTTSLPRRGLSFH